MSRFRYRAVDPDGVRVEGTVEADSLQEATERLRADEVEVIAIEAVDSFPRHYEPSGPRPPSRPRVVDVKLSEQPGGWVLVIIGGVFSAVAAILIVVGVVLLAAGEAMGLFFTLFPLVHLTVGLAMLWFGFRGRARRRRIYRDGEVAMGTIEGVGYNRSVSVNGENPFELVWAFEVDEHRYHDKRLTFDERAMSFVPGDRIWVLYDRDDPEQSVEWPRLD